jgi:hypothetical protein
MPAWNLVMPVTPVTTRPAAMRRTSDAPSGRTVGDRRRRLLRVLAGPATPAPFHRPSRGRRRRRSTCAGSGARPR